MDDPGLSPLADLPEGQTHSGFVGLAGRPNVGKSTLWSGRP